MEGLLTSFTQRRLVETSFGEELFHPSPIDFIVESSETLCLKFPAKRGKNVMRPVSDDFLFFKFVLFLSI